MFDGKIQADAESYQVANDAMRVALPDDLLHSLCSSVGGSVGAKTAQCKKLVNLSRRNSAAVSHFSAAASKSTSMALMVLGVSTQVALYPIYGLSTFC